MNDSDLVYEGPTVYHRLIRPRKWGDSRSPCGSASWGSAVSRSNAEENGRRPCRRCWKDNK